jgi:hypothetical protein
MGGLASDIFPVRRDIDVQMDDTELLPNRYQKRAKMPLTQPGIVQH